jgi:ABC-2 type transport system permease protein
MLRRLYSQIYKHGITLLTWPGEWATILVYPFIGLLSLGLFTSYVAGKGAGSEAFIFVIYGVMSWNIYSNAMQVLTRGFYYELWDGTLKNLFLARIKIKEFIFGNMMFAFMTMMAITIMLTIFSMAVFNFNIFSAGPLVLLGLSGLVLHAFSDSMMVLSLLIKYGNKFTNLAWIIPGFIMILSGVYYPITALPKSVQVISMILPSTHAINGMRSLTLAPELAIGELLLGLALGSIYLFISLNVFKYAYHLSKKDGSLVTLTN